MKKLLIIILVKLSVTNLSAQSISPFGVYGAASSKSKAAPSVHWVLGSLTPGVLSPLPVRLISFEGRLTGSGTAELRWKTADEVNNQGFEIQKSIDGKNYEAIGWVDGSGTSNGEKAYQFLDPTLYTTSYYRLKQVDFGGQSTLSNIVSVIPAAESLDRLVGFPNPSLHGWVDITVPERTYSLSIHNQKGMLVQEQALPTGSQKYLLPEKGLYVLRIKAAAGEKTIKLIRD